MHYEPQLQAYGILAYPILLHCVTVNGILSLLIYYAIDSEDLLTYIDLR
jgi:hypothetical protein